MSEENIVSILGGAHSPKGDHDEDSLFLKQSTQEGDVAAKRRKKVVRYAMLVAYQGKNYFGMQIQKDVAQPTIEFHLLRALFELGYITEEERMVPNKFYFQRAARTDKGVSAVRQMCSMFLPLNEDLAKSGTQELNALLPEDIRVLGIRRATPTFNAQKGCDYRTYSYTLPTYAFAPIKELTNSAYRISEERLKEVDETLTNFVGTHNFYNYTSKKEHSDKSCIRYIVSFKCDQPFLHHDKTNNCEVEFLSIYVKGQSFMLHQIRKMIGVTIAVIRGFMNQEEVGKSFKKERMDIPKAPGEGLLLEQLHYQRYDERFSRSHQTLNHWGDQIESTILEVRKSLIIDDMLDNECCSQSMMDWLQNLANHWAMKDQNNVQEQNLKYDTASHIDQTFE